MNGPGFRLLEKRLLDAINDELNCKCGDSIAFYDHYQIGTDAILRVARRWD
ncbi:hypothetical protein [Thalassospira povalilytica]|uniref:hypothetical protein n=1 Tax=Thalassospira povalilytica TaxID=732237 RepID=UPI003AA8E64B